MAASVTVIGRAARVRGRLSGDGDIQVEGQVVGEIVTTGNVTIDAHGIVGANVRGKRLVVRGAVQGDLLGDEAVVLESGARVVGDVRAPRVAIAHGALMRGEVQTGDDSPAAPLVRSQGSARAAVAPASRATPSPATKAIATPAVKVAPATSPNAAARPAPSSSGNSGASPRRPPPPVVPVLKKTKGQILKKKER
jgi:cytoskeletal protein CcmA (bactofilin family)